MGIGICARLCVYIEMETRSAEYSNVRRGIVTREASMRRPFVLRTSAVWGRGSNCVGIVGEDASLINTLIY